MTVHIVDANDDFTFNSGDTLVASFHYVLNADSTKQKEIDTDDEGNTATYVWGYDALMRLTSETYANSADASANYIAAYSFDLSSNRMSKIVEHAASTSDIDTFNADGTFTADETDSYTYDADDRLLTETDDKAGTVDDTLTVYTWGDSNAWTMQTYKTVYSGTAPLSGDAETDDARIISTTHFEYDDQGRMSKLTVTPTGGTATTTTYNYGPDGTRIRQIIDDGTTTTNILYLVDTNNPTGYSQTLEECTFDGTLWTKKTYTLGLDVIAQYDTAHPCNGTLTFLYDGHGSTRALMNAMAAVIQRFAYDAFGNQLSANNLTSAASDLTNLLYSGEQTDPSGMQYLRARYYDPNTGTFPSLDPSSGTNHDPVSLHKYLYANGNPIFYYDPSGRFSLAEIVTTMGIDEDLEGIQTSYGTIKQTGEVVKTLVRIILIDLSITVASIDALSPVWKGFAELYYAYEWGVFSRKFRGERTATLSADITTLTSYLAGLPQGAQLLDSYHIDATPANFLPVLTGDVQAVTFIPLTGSRTDDNYLAFAAYTAENAEQFAKSLWMGDWAQMAEGLGRTAALAAGVTLGKFGNKAGSSWHHSEIMGAMVLLPGSSHESTHDGGVLLWNIINDTNKYNT